MVGLKVMRGDGGLCDYRVSSLALAQSLTMIHCDTCHRELINNDLLFVGNSQHHAHSESRRKTVGLQTYVPCHGEERTYEAERGLSPLSCFLSPEKKLLRDFCSLF